MNKIILLLISMAVAGCAATPATPVYNQAPEKVGYMGKFNYWQPAKKATTLSTKAQATRNRLTKNGAVVLIYQYDIDSNGLVHNIALLTASPTGSATTEDVVAANLIFSSWKAAAQNPANTPVKVTERIVLAPNGIGIPPDNMSIDDYLKSMSAKQ